MVRIELCMTQLNLEELLKIDNESYNLFRVISMFMKLDESQNVPLQAMADFWVCSNLSKLQ